ncbi:MAG: hypothetical protein ACR2JC_03435 [Chloroflexota bacterium]
MPPLRTPRLILVPTPLPVINKRLECDDFVAAVSVPLDPNTQTGGGELTVRFPPEWPGDALA